MDKWIKLEKVFLTPHITACASYSQKCKNKRPTVSYRCPEVLDLEDAGPGIRFSEDTKIKVVLEI